MPTLTATFHDVAVLLSTGYTVLVTEFYGRFYIGTADVTALVVRRVS